MAEHEKAKLKLSTYITIPFLSPTAMWRPSGRMSIERTPLAVSATTDASPGKELLSVRKLLFPKSL